MRCEEDDPKEKNPFASRELIIESTTGKVNGNQRGALNLKKTRPEKTRAEIRRILSFVE